MSDEEEKCPPCPAGLPAWLNTFADLMSLLMCFFVLLLSFSEMDALKFKRLAGSLRNAFGVQRLINVADVPKGTSIIAQEFSPGRPDPTPLNVIRQFTTDLEKSSLEVLCQDEVTRQEEAQGDTGKQTRQIQMENTQAVEATQEQAAVLAQELVEEIESGKVEIETQGQKIVIRIRDQGAFRPGSSYVEDEYLPVLDKIRDLLMTVPGKIAVEGHTDSSGAKDSVANWYLSSARAVAVAEQLFISPDLSEKRFMVVGHADTQPLRENTSREGRSANRRVEIIIYKSQDPEDDQDSVPEIADDDPNVQDQLRVNPDDVNLRPDEIF